MIRPPPISTLFPYSTLFLSTAPATTDIYTLSLHDALPISPVPSRVTASRPPGTSTVQVPLATSGTVAGPAPAPISAPGVADAIAAATTAATAPVPHDLVAPDPRS